MGKVIFNGISIHYRCLGEGRNVVLIHGLAANQGFWSPSVLLPLARAYRVTLFDLRGHGYSAMPSSGYTPADMANDLYHLLDYLDIHQADLIGHSFGGVVALQSALLFPERVRSLTLADTRVRIFQPNQGLGDWLESEKILKGLEELELVIPGDEKEAGLWLLEQLASPRWKEVKEKLKDTELFIPFAGWNGGNRSAQRWLKLLRTTTAREELISSEGLSIVRLSEIQQPTLAICGEITLTMASLQGLQKHLPRCRTAIIQNAGHFFPMTHPQVFVSTVSRFLEEVGRVERRKYERFLFRIPVEIKGMGMEGFDATTANVSQNGLLLETSKKLEMGSEVEVIAIPDLEDRRLILRGVVARMAEKLVGRPYGFGIKLLSQGLGKPAWERFLAAGYPFD